MGRKIELEVLSSATQRLQKMSLAQPVSLSADNGEQEGASPGVPALFSANEEPNARSVCATVRLKELSPTPAVAGLTIACSFLGFVAANVSSVTTALLLLSGLRVSEGPAVHHHRRGGRGTGLVSAIHRRSKFFHLKGRVKAISQKKPAGPAFVALPVNFKFGGYGEFARSGLFR